MDTQLTVDSTSRALGKLALMSFFPTGDEAQAALVRAVMKMVDTEEHLHWLTERALELYPRWPGIGELRALYCSRYRPKDGVEAYSEIYERFPHESRPEQCAPEPADAPVSSDKGLDGKVREMAKARRLK